MNINDLNRILSENAEKRNAAYKKLMETPLCPQANNDYRRIVQETIDSENEAYAAYAEAK